METPVQGLMFCLRVMYNGSPPPPPQAWQSRFLRYTGREVAILPKSSTGTLLLDCPEEGTLMPLQGTCQLRSTRKNYNTCLIGFEVLGWIWNSEHVTLAYWRWVQRSISYVWMERACALNKPKTISNLTKYITKLQQDETRSTGFIECFTTTFLHTHSWLNWVDEDDWWGGWLERKTRRHYRYITKITSK